MIGSYSQHYLHAHCLCGHVGKVSMFDLCIKLGRTYDLQRVIDAMRCTECGGHDFEMHFSADMRWLGGGDEWVKWQLGWDSQFRAWPVVREG